MTNTYEVSCIMVNSDGEWRYHLYYSGDSIIRAVLAMWQARLDGQELVKLDWRPRGNR